VSTEYQIIDNALSKEQASFIKNTMISQEFPWFYSGVVEGEYDIQQYYFTHNFFKRHNWLSNWAEQIVGPILSVLDPVSLIRIKGNFYPRSTEFLENNSHIDYDFPHMGAIYYVNTNDGFTVLEDGTQIESVENRILLFDPSKLHNSTHCTNEHGRVNINFNFFK
jgi:hypothetical protein